MVPFKAIPPHVVNAFVAAEDANFFQHKGVDYVAIARAIVKDVVSGGYAQGASTITQQTVKSLFLTPEKSIARKLKEMILAYRIEKMLSKEEILYLYLNQIYLGDGAYGVEAAAQTYFAQGGFHPHPRGRRAPRRAGPGALPLLAAGPPRQGEGPPAVRAAPDGGGGIHRQGRRGEGVQGAPGPGAPLHLPFEGRLLPRVRPQLPPGEVRRGSDQPERVPDLHDDRRRGCRKRRTTP